MRRSHSVINNSFSFYWNCTNAMIKAFVISLFLLLGLSKSIQAQDSYFQQKVEYRITSSLDTSAHTMTTGMDLLYTNNSPTDLQEIFMHLWTNAFSDKQSPFAKQFLRMGQTSFYYADVKDLGGYQEMKVSLGNQELEVTYHDTSNEIMSIPLPKPLKNGETIKLRFDYVLKIPKLFSRMGRSDSTYHLAYWHPRPAVYDRNGWHKMSYLSLGEFYGELGIYDISLTVPSNFKIASSANRFNPAREYEGGLTKWRLRGQEYHDFTIVLDPEIERKNSLMVPSSSGNNIRINVFHYGTHDFWDKAVEYAQEAFTFLDKEIGPFPYQQMTIVQGINGGMGGMEYPALTIIDCNDEEALEYYIVHELAHMWFYGGLNFNERKEPWLDEGLASFYEKKWTKKTKGKDYYSHRFPFIKDKMLELDLQLEGLMNQEARRMYEGANTPAEEISLFNYGFSAYVRSSYGWKYLESYLGEAKFRSCMQSFYSDWNGKHPDNEVAKQHFEKCSGKDLSWLFEDWFKTNKKLDYKIRDITKDDLGYVVNLENNGDIDAPLIINGIKDGESTVSLWVEPFKGEKKVEFEAENLDGVTIDFDGESIDVNRRNNHIRTNTLFKKRDPSVAMFPTSEYSKKSYLYALPAVGLNYADGFYLGPAFGNGSYRVKNFEYFVMPAYAFKSKSFVGFGWMSYDFYTDKSKRFRKLEAKLAARTFNKRHFNLGGTDERIFDKYYKWQPSVSLHFRHAPGSGKQSYLAYRTVFLAEDQNTFSDSITVTQTLENSVIHELSYKYKNVRTLNPNEFSLALEQQSYETFFGESENYLKLEGEFFTKLNFTRKLGLDLRLWSGYFISNTQRQSSQFFSHDARGSFTLFYQGFNDYLYDQFYYNRTGQEGKLLGQMSTEDGGFSNALGSTMRIGMSNDFAASLHLGMDMPVRPLGIPFKAYIDIGYVSTKSFGNDPLEGKFLWSGGLSLGNQYFRLNFPLFYASEIGDIYEQQDKNLLEKISFTINLHKLSFNFTRDNVNF